MFGWEAFVNEVNDDIDPLIKMALMHYQFEAIHPFSDGNGRTGRILNVLYLVHKKLLHLPVLYLSDYIIQNKSDYYRLLKEITEKDAWLEWISFMLDAIAETSILTLKKISEMLQLKKDTLERMRNISQKIPAFEVNELIFSFPYIKIKTIIDYRIAQRQAASNYLQVLVEMKILVPFKLGREVYFINKALMELLTKGVGINKD